VWWTPADFLPLAGEWVIAAWAAPEPEEWEIALVVLELDGDGFTWIEDDGHVCTSPSFWTSLPTVLHS
jgi:hypothetical protein